MADILTELQQRMSGAPKTAAGGVKVLTGASKDNPISKSLFGDVLGSAIEKPTAGKVELEARTGAINAAMQYQLAALAKARDLILTDSDPAKVAKMAAEQDLANAKGRIEAQATTDPGLAKVRQASANQLLTQVNTLGDGTAEFANVVKQAAAPDPQLDAIKQRLQQEAINELNLGGSLPPDVQAEVMRAGLERGGTVLGRATGQGAGANISRELIGERGLALRQQRQQNAAGLAGAAQQLHNNRLGLLATLFPALKQTQNANLAGAGNALQIASNELPNAGLTGSDVANLWMARLGALNQLTTDTGSTAAQGALALGETVAGKSKDIVNSATRRVPTGLTGWTTTTDPVALPKFNNLLSNFKW